VASREDGREQEALHDRRRMAREKYHKLRRDARRKQLTARTIQAGSSGRRISYREICMTGADGPSRVDSVVQKAGQLSRTALGRMNRAKEEMESVTFRKSYRRGIELPGEQSDRNSLAELPEGEIVIGGLHLVHPRLSVLPTDRIALTGPNGSGKSTLVKLLVESMELPEGRLLYIPQELTADQSARVLSTAGDLGPGTLGGVMSCVRRLGSDPEPLLKSALPSPGETRKLMLCLGLLENPWIVIMDEPTNHLDLPGIECLEAALSELECALLLVSHDRRFLSNTTEMEWRITDDGRGKNLRIFRVRI
jgi:macrolide transport system ATP-binding/permease protein